MIQKFFKRIVLAAQPVQEIEKKISEPSARLRLAQHGESFARHYLKRQGWKIKEQNWRLGRGCEIDIIAVEPPKTLVFVEVKARKLGVRQVGFPHLGFESINEVKRKKLLGAASQYLAKYHDSQVGCRFDAIVLYYPDEQLPDSESPFKNPQIHHVKGMF
jgi:putative endonuclease